MSTTFKKLPFVSHQKAGVNVTPDTLYWKKLEFPITRKEHGAVSHVEFSPVEPYNYLSTVAAKCQLFNSRSHEVVKTYSRVKEAAYGGSFRSDGRLLVVGSEEATVRLFDVPSKALLRMFKGHTAGVHAARFTSDLHHVVSVSDDKSCRLWDVASGDQLTAFTQHQDYVRSVATSSQNQHLFLSGSYDHTARLFDTRQDDSVLTLQHGAPIEDVMMFPGGSLVITAGGTCIKVWDVLAGGRLLTSFSNHHKTVTSLTFCSKYQRLASAGLDRHVNIYDVSSYQVVHTLEYPAPILSLAIAPDDSLVVVGMSDGLMSVQRRKEDSAASTAPRVRKKKASFRYQLNAHTHTPSPSDEVVELRKREKMAKYDEMLRKFENSQALDAAMEVMRSGTQPEIPVAVFQELIRRDRLHAALAGRDSKSLSHILKFLKRFIGVPQYTSILIDVANVVLDLYAEHIGEWTQLDDLLLRLREAVDHEVSYMAQLMGMMGAMDTMFTAAQTPPTNINQSEESLMTSTNLAPLSSK